MNSKLSASDLIINTRAKRVEVLASPGSGKTHTLIERIQHLLSTGVLAQEILVLSFSNVSVNEVRRRMNTQHSNLEAKKIKLGQAADSNTDFSEITVKTAHGFAFGVIHNSGGNVKVLSEKAACTLLGKAMRSARKDCRKSVLWPDISQTLRSRRLQQLEELSELPQIKLVLGLLSVVQASKVKLLAATEMSQFEGLKRYFNVLLAVRRQFAAIKKKLGVVDYGDMLAHAVTAIGGGASVPFTHILVDEYQDCSAAQTHLLAKLAGLDGRSIMVFGDPYQAIFHFAGASYTPLSSVLKGVQKLNLPVSRRLTAQTAALASAVAQHSAKQAIQTSRDGDSPVLVQDDSLAGQTKHVVQDIQQLIASGTPPEQIVVLARTKALLAPVEQLLLAENVLTKRKGIKRNRKHALRVLKLVRLIERNEKAKAVFKPEMLCLALPNLADMDDGHWNREFLALKKVARVQSLEGRYRLCAKVYLRLMGGAKANAELRADINRWEPWCRGHENALAMRAAVKAIDIRGVTTGTIHSAKGGEWDHVLVVGVTDGLLPLYLARDEQSLGEERNLLYVAITRARDTVRLYHAPTDHARSRQRFENISRFIDEPVVREALLIA